MKLKILAILASLAIGYLAGVFYNEARYYPLPDKAMTTEEAIDFFEHARRLHQYFVDHPDRILYSGDSVGKQERYVEIYTQLLVLVEELK